MNEEQLAKLVAEYSNEELVNRVRGSAHACVYAVARQCAAVITDAQKVDNGNKDVLRLFLADLCASFAGLQDVVNEFGRDFNAARKEIEQREYYGH